MGFRFVTGDWGAGDGDAADGAGDGDDDDEIYGDFEDLQTGYGDDDLATRSIRRTARGVADVERMTGLAGGSPTGAMQC